MTKFSELEELKANTKDSTKKAEIEKSISEYEGTLMKMENLLVTHKQREENINEIYDNKIRTAHQFMESSNFYQIVLYSGLIDNENISKDTQQLDLNRVFQNYWLKWLMFRVMSTSLNWKFLVNKNRWRNNHILDTYYAYRQKLWIKRISKTSLNKREYEIEIECDIERN